jgi:hypothetical protein
MWNAKKKKKKKKNIDGIIRDPRAVGNAANEHYIISYSGLT